MSADLLHTPLHDLHLTYVAQSRDPLAGEPLQVTARAVGPAGRLHHDALRRKVPPLPPGQRLDGDLVADPLDENDGVHPATVSLRTQRSQPNCAA